MELLLLVLFTTFLSRVILHCKQIVVELWHTVTCIGLHAPWHRSVVFFSVYFLEFCFTGKKSNVLKYVGDLQNEDKL